MVSLVPRLSPREPPVSVRDERVRAAFAAAPVGLGLAGFDGRWLLFNDTAATLLGYTREELGRISLHDITHAEDLPRELAYLRRMSEGEGQRYRIEKRVVDKHGNMRELVFTAALVRGRDGQKDTIVYVIEKPGPRVESGNTADGMSQAVLDRLPETAVIRCDARGTILGWNVGAQQLFGYTHEEIIGRNRRVLYKDGDGDAAAEHLRVAAERHQYEGEGVRVTRAGREVTMRVAITAFAPDGAVRGFVEVMHMAAAPVRYSEQFVSQLREQLQIERDSNATMMRVVENLREKLARRDEEPSAEWTPLREGGALDVVARMARDKRSGLLIFVSGTRQKSVHLEEGRIASCASSDPGESMGEQLVRRGAISEAQRVKAVEMADRTNVAIGRAVVILGAMREEDVVRALHEKIDRELVELQSWTGGRWTFVNRLPPRVKPVRVALDVAELRQFARAEFVASRSGARYHRESCNAMARVRETERVAILSALHGAERGLAPCRICVAAR